MIESNSCPSSLQSRVTTSAFGVAARNFGISACLLLAACAPHKVRPVVAGDDAVQRAREARLATEGDWSFSGRIALSRAGDGGSGRIDWIQRGDDFDIRLSAPITRQGWRMTGRDGKVRLEGLEGGVREGKDAEALLLEATGWRVPVKAMVAWVRGVRAEGPADISFDQHGLPATLQQWGWAVEYRDWDAAEPARPTRVFARQDQASVRLVIDQWQSP